MVARGSSAATGAGPRKRAHRTLWVGVISLLLAACGPDPAAAIVRQIIEELSVQRYGTATARYRQNEDLVLSPAAAPAWRRGLEHEDATVREWSVDSLARIGEPEDVSRVVAALDDPFRNVQEAAARSLVDLDPEAALAAFRERLSSDEPMTKTLAAQGLADLGDAAAVEPLIGEFRRDELEPAVRRVLAQTLARLGDSRAVASLAEVAGDASVDLGLRRDAAEALATFDDPAAVVALRALLASDDAYIQEIARRAIAGQR